MQDIKHFARIDVQHVHDNIVVRCYYRFKLLKILDQEEILMIAFVYRVFVKWLE